MGQLRRSNENKGTLKKLSKTRDLKGALELMVSLQGSTFMEEEVVTEYDRKTGKPAKHAWQPYRKFGTDFTFGGESYGGDINVELTDEVIDEIKKGPVCFDRKDKRYVAKFETKDHSGSDRGGYNHCIEHLIYLSELRIL